MKKLATSRAWLLIGVGAMVMTGEAEVRAQSSPVESVSLDEVTSILDLEPLELSEDHSLPQEVGPWTRRRVRAWLWSQRRYLSRCLEQADRTSPLPADGVVVGLSLAPGASVSAPDPRLSPCLDELLKAFPDEALRAPVRYEVRLTHARLQQAGEVLEHRMSAPKLEISGAQPGLEPLYVEDEREPALHLKGSAPLSGEEAPRSASYALFEPLVARSAELQGCYAEVLRRNPDLGGELTVSLEITGAASARRVSKPGIGQMRWEKNSANLDAESLRCMEAAIRRWQLPQLAGAERPSHLSFSWQVGNLATRELPLASATPPFWSAALNASPGAPEEGTLVRLAQPALQRARAVLGHCHKRSVSPSAPLGLVMLRLGLDSRYGHISQVEILNAEGNASDFERCVSRRLSGSEVYALSSWPQRALVQITWPVEFRPALASQSYTPLDKDLEGKLLRGEHAPSPLDVLGPTYVHDHGKLARAARHYTVHGMPERALEMHIELMESSYDSLTRLRHLKRALELGASHALPAPLYHQLLIELSRRQAPIGLAPVLLSQQVERTLEEHMRAEAMRMATLSRELFMPETLVQESEALLRAYQERFGDVVEVQIERGLMLLSLHREEEALRVFEETRRGAQQPETIEALVLHEVRAMAQQSARDCQRVTRAGEPTLELCVARLARRVEEVVGDEALSAATRAEALSVGLDVVSAFALERRAKAWRELLYERFDIIDIPIRYAP